MSGLPTAEDLSFLHSGLCQVGLPHSRPADNNALWHRQSGRFLLMVQPGVIEADCSATARMAGRVASSKNAPETPGVVAAKCTLVS